jgi:hypothetical protein
VYVSVRKPLYSIIGLGSENDDDEGSQNIFRADGTPDEDDDSERPYNSDDDADRSCDNIEPDRDADHPMETEDDNGRPSSPQAGQKRARCNSGPAQPDKFREAIKLKNSKGKPKADDWELDVQEILARAILFYENRLATQGLFPDHMEEVAWAKLSWLDGCRDCDLKIHHNSELIKIVSFLLYR